MTGNEPSDAQVSKRVRWAIVAELRVLMRVEEHESDGEYSIM